MKRILESKIILSYLGLLTILVLCVSPDLFIQPNVRLNTYYDVLLQHTATYNFSQWATLEYKSKFGYFEQSSFIMMNSVSSLMGAQHNLVVNGSANSYPPVLSKAPKDSLVDPWGMYNRECVSYTAFKVAQSGRTMPYWGGIGNAQQWPSNARADGIPVDRNPLKGDIAIAFNSEHGHAMYVEAVNGRDVIISQYNWPVNGQWGVWSEMTLSADNSGLGPMYFIHFP